MISLMSPNLISQTVSNLEEFETEVLTHVSISWENIDPQLVSSAPIPLSFLAQCNNKIVRSNNHHLPLLVTDSKKAACRGTVLYWVLSGAGLFAVSSLITDGGKDILPLIGIGAGIGVIAWFITCGG